MVQKVSNSRVVQLRLGLQTLPPTHTALPHRAAMPSRTPRVCFGEGDVWEHAPLGVAEG